MPLQQEILDFLGSAATNQVVQRFYRLAFLPDAVISTLSNSALAENWGADNYALVKYLAIHVPWSIEQGHFSVAGEQFYVTAGHLQTRYGTPIYLVFERNRNPDRQPFALVYAGSDVAGELPAPPEIPPAPEPSVGAEIVMLHDHILGDNSHRVPFLNQTPRVAQMCAVAGAIQWSLNRRLQLAQWYFGRMHLLVPLYLQTRENITQAPDVIAPIQVSDRSLIVRTVLASHMPYANARVAVHRHDQLPHWMLDAWNAHAAQATRAQIEDPEATAASAGLQP